MKIIEFEPGDGTRYLVGIEPVDPASSKMMGWGQPAVMFYFGPGSSARGGVVGIKDVCSGDMMKYMGFEDSIYVASAAACVFAHLTGVEAFGSCVSIAERWDSAAAEGKMPMGPWRQQLDALKQPTTR